MCSSKQAARTAQHAENKEIFADVERRYNLRCKSLPLQKSGNFIDSAAPGQRITEKNLTLFQ
jgi:hypothetical protein